MIIHKTGDLFTSTAGMLAHGVNALGVMGSGIAVQFRERFPEMHEHYVALCDQPDAITNLPGKVYLWVESESLAIANLFSQDYPGPKALYSWTIQAVNEALIYAELMGIDTVALPRIGCGVGGLNWNAMLGYLEELAEQHTINIEIWSL